MIRRKQLSQVTSPVECAEKAENTSTQAIVFGLQDGGTCFTGDSVSSAISLSSVSNCPRLGGSYTNQVFVRKYCFPGWTPVSSYTGNVLTLGCRKCRSGYYCLGDHTEIPCPMDFSTNNSVGYSKYVKCDTDGGYSTIGLTGQSNCTAIPVGYYWNTINYTLEYSGTNETTQHWVGGGYNKNTCRCRNDATGRYVGDLCDIPMCVDFQPYVSLGTLLFNSDSILLQVYKSDISNTLRHLYNLLSVTIDVNGDGIIAKEEMLRYLKSRSISSTGMEKFPLWFAPDKTEFDIYPVEDLYKEAQSLYWMSPKKKFDASGLTYISNLTSTFPNPLWDDLKCDAYDVSRPSHKDVVTSWNFTERSGIT